jgi:hypothetical protein
MSSLWDAVFVQVLDRTGPLMRNLSGTPYIQRHISMHNSLSLMDFRGPLNISNSLNSLWI